MADLLDGYWRLQPLSRSIATFAFVVSCGSFVGLVDLSWIAYAPFFVFKFPPEIWRLVTGFFITGSNISILFDTYFLYHYMSQLEVGHPRMPRKADLIWYLIFVGGIILAIDGYMGFRDYHFIWPLTLAMAYTVTQQQQGMKVNYMFIEIPAPMMPFAMLLISMFYPNGVQHAIFQAYGLVAAHLYEFLTKIWPTLGGGVNLIPTPPLLVKLVNFLEGRVQDAQQSYNARFGGAPSNRSTSASTSGASVNPPLPDSWRTRGGGRRLG